MKNLLHLRPPRRHPRLLGIRATKSALVSVSLDPWEVRNMITTDLDPKADNERKIVSTLEALLVRERPHALVVSSSALKLRKIVSDQAKRFHLPAILVSSRKTSCMASLPSGHRVAAKSALVSQAVAMTYAGLLIILQNHYDQRKYKPFR